ncbi:MAG: enoyl-CoA hydratase-related protein [Candidatus Binatia bacterium]
MKYRQILYSVDDAVATITLDRPDRLNAWTLVMENELKHAMLSAEKDDDVRVIVLTGAGRGFCSGADMSLLGGAAGRPAAAESDGNGAEGSGSASEDFAGWKARRPDFDRPLGYFLSVLKPVIAAINGPAVGIGFVIPLYCDIRIMAAGATIGTVFSRRGLVAEYGVAWLLPRLVGMGAACDLLFSGRLVSSAEALRIGLVERTVPDEILSSTVAEYARGLATQVSPRSVRVMKRQLWDSQFQDLGSAIDVSLDEMLQSFSGEDFHEGIAHFLEKRPPRFSGR